MELLDGFIVSIFNYCDRWCERCAFTSHCRLFADMARAQAAMDPALAAVVHAPGLPADAPPPPPAWLEELIEEAESAAATMSEEELDRCMPKVPIEHGIIEDRARDYGRAAFRWLEMQHQDRAGSPGDPLAVVSWFQVFIPAKVHRALLVLPGDGDDGPSDADGSAKIALLAIEESQAAWRALAECGRASEADASGFVADLAWLARALECARPRARQFVRPGFDEPDEVAAMLGPAR
jgi:hypothetical protein